MVINVHVQKNADDEGGVFGQANGDNMIKAKTNVIRRIL